MSRTVRTMLIYLVVITVGVTIINSFVSTATAPGEMTLDALQENVRGGLITSVVIKQQSNVVTGEFNDGAGTSSFETTFPEGYEGDLTALLLDSGVTVETDSENPTLLQWFLGTILPYILIFGVFIFILMRLQGGGNRVMSFGKAKAKQVTRDMPKVTFGDVAGAEEAVEELEEIKEFLAKP